MWVCTAACSARTRSTPMPGRDLDRGAVDGDREVQRVRRGAGEVEREPLETGLVDVRDRVAGRVPRRRPGPELGRTGRRGTYLAAADQQLLTRSRAAAVAPARRHLPALMRSRLSSWPGGRSPGSAFRRHQDPEHDVDEDLRAGQQTAETKMSRIVFAEMPNRRASPAQTPPIQRPLDGRTRVLAMGTDFLSADGLTTTMTPSCPDAIPPHRPSRVRSGVPRRRSR